MSDLEVVAQGTGRLAREARRTLKRRAKARAAGGGAADFAALEQTLDDLAARIDPGERKALARDIAKDLRTANSARIRGNVEPGGEPMTPRKLRVGKNGSRDRTRRVRDPLTKTKRLIRGGRMFIRAATAKYLRTESSIGEAQVGYVGAMARIMAVHQYGLEDSVSRDPASPKAVYPARVVLGMTEDDRVRILEQLSSQVGG